MTFASLETRRISYTLSGVGNPAVIFENGLGSTQEDWAAVFSAVAQFTQVLSYDRAGLGESDPAPTPRTCQDMVDDLNALLTQVGIAPPYLLVAHSFGGLNARLFVAQHPQWIAGLLLVDPSHEDRDVHFERVMSEDLIQRNRRYLADPSRNSETIDRLASNAQVRTARHDFDFPVIVLARGLPDEPDLVWPSAALQQVEAELQRKLAAACPKGSFRLAEKSGHFVQQDQPELVIECIRQLLIAASQ